MLTLEISGIVAGVSTGVALLLWLVQHLVQHLVPHGVRREHNDVAGFVYAVLGVFAIRQPFHGALVIGPDDLRAVMASFGAGAG